MTETIAPAAFADLAEAEAALAEAGKKAGSAIAADQLRSFVERIERLEEEKAALAQDIAEVFTELKSAGFDAKIVRQVLRLRRMDRAQFQENEALLDIYMAALGMAD